MKRLGGCKGKVIASDALREWPRAKLFMRKLMAIALLPAHCIADAFEVLVATTEADITLYFQDLTHIIEDNGSEK